MPQSAILHEEERSSEGSHFQLELDRTSVSTHHRHQRSLESILDFQHLSLDPSERARAKKIFSQVLEASVPTVDPPPPFDAANLLRLSLQYNPSERGRDNFLSYVLRNYDHVEGNTSTGLCPTLPFTQVLNRLDQTISTWPSPPPKWVAHRTADLANLIIYSFFLPLKGQATKTPQPTPHLTPVGGGMHTPTLNRISRLRATCLARDSHRCVISGYFDWATAEGRIPLIDDGGQPLAAKDVFVTEVVHIIPHALGEATHKNAPLDSDKTMFWDVMKLFDPGIEQLLNGVEIDRPFNAMTMTVDLHQSFGNLKWYLEEDSHHPEPHTYLFKVSPGVGLGPNPVFRPQNEREQVRFVSADGTDLPDRGLLALHRACAKILGMSGAGEYIDKILRDHESIRLGNCGKELEQGSVDLAGMVSWRLALCAKIDF